MVARSRAAVCHLQRPYGWRTVGRSPRSPRDSRKSSPDENGTAEALIGAFLVFDPVLGAVIGFPDAVFPSIFFTLVTISGPESVHDLYVADPQGLLTAVAGRIPF